MALMRWDPYGEMLQMQRDLDRMFSRTGAPGGQAGMTTWMPRINVKQSGDDLTMQVELAGIKPEDVDVEVTDNVLTIHGERTQETEREDEGWVVRESGFGEFERSVVLPDGVDPNSIHADFHDGMLDVSIPKGAKQMQPQTTKVAIGGTQGQQRQMGQGQQGQMGQQGQGQKESVQTPVMSHSSQGGSMGQGQQGQQGQGQQGTQGQSPLPPETEEERQRREQPVGTGSRGY